MEMFAYLFIIGLSFVFHCVVWEDDYVKKWYCIAKFMTKSNILASTLAHERFIQENIVGLRI